MYAGYCHIFWGIEASSPYEIYAKEGLNNNNNKRIYNSQVLQLQIGQPDRYLHWTYKRLQTLHAH